MWSPGSSVTRRPMRVIKHVSIEHCASTCRGRQAEVADLGLEIGRIATSALSQCGEDWRCSRGRGTNVAREIARYRAVSYSGAPRSTKMGTIRSPWRYDVVLESTLSTTNARPGGRSFYAGRRMTGVPGLHTGMALPVPSRMTPQVQAPRSRLRMPAFALYCTQASTDDRSRALNDLHSAGRRCRQEAAGEAGQEHGPQPFFPRGRGDPRVPRRQRVAGCRHQASDRVSRSWRRSSARAVQLGHVLGQ